jgi:hypothetical protein
MAQAFAPRDTRQFVAIRHPRLTAWTGYGAWVRISLRRNPVSVTRPDNDPEPPAIMPVTPMSGPFFDSADGE